MTLIDKLQPFLTDMDNCLENGQYNAALFIALALPDICSSTDKSRFGTNVGKRYRNWIDLYFIKQNNYEKNVKMSADDFYSLRCAYLHSGLNKLDRQSVANVISKFEFVVSPSQHMLVHKNSIINGNINTLQLDVNSYCNEIKKSVESYVSESNGNKTINAAAENILHVKNIDHGFIL